MKHTILYTKNPKAYTEVLSTFQNNCFVCTEESHLTGQLLKSRPLLLMIETDSVREQGFPVGELTLDENTAPPTIIYGNVQFLKELLLGENPMRESLPPYEIPQKMQQVLDKVLLQFEFSPSLRGYHYLKQAFYYEHLNSRQISAVKKDIYEAVSQCYETSIYSVERGISFSIRKAYEKNPTNFQEMFSSLEKPPSNMQFLKRFYIYMKQSGLF